MAVNHSALSGIKHWSSPAWERGDARCPLTPNLVLAPGAARCVALSYLGSGTLCGIPPSATTSFCTIFLVQVGKVQSSVFLFFFPGAWSSTLSSHIPGSPNPGIM